MTISGIVKRIQRGRRDRSLTESGGTLITTTILKGNKKVSVSYPIGGFPRVVIPKEILSAVSDAVKASGGEGFHVRYHDGPARAVSLESFDGKEFAHANDGTLFSNAAQEMGFLKSRFVTPSVKAYWKTGRR